MDDNRLPKKIKLQTWREKKYRKATNEMGRWFQEGRNRTRGLSLIVDDDDDDDDEEDWNGSIHVNDMNSPDHKHFAYSGEFALY